MSDSAWKLMAMMNDLDQYQDPSRGMLGVWWVGTLHTTIYFFISYYEIHESTENILDFYFNSIYFLITLCITRHIWKTRMKEHKSSK